MFEEEQIKVFRVTLKKVIERLSDIKDCEVSNLKDKIIEQFDGYNYEGEEDVVGMDSWCDISKDGKYELSAKIDHEDAYEFTIYIEVKDGLATVYNIL